MKRFLFSVLLLALAVHVSSPAQAQQEPKFGIGVQALGSTADNSVGPGLRFRVSAPINQEVSLGVGTGLTGYIFEGRDDAAYAFDPQASVIVTLPGMGTESVYFMGGGGAYIPFGNTTSESESGPTFHFGVGKAWLLRDSSLFFEFDPALLVGEENTQVLIPVRVGVIF